MTSYPECSETVRLSSVLGAASLALLGMIGLVGCVSGGGSYEERIVEAAQSGATYTLPQLDSPVGAWSQLVVLCPYSTDALGGGLPGPFSEAASKIDTGSSDEAQWLLFRSETRVEALRLSRDRVDFCAGEKNSEQIYEADTSWTVHEADSRLVVTALQ